MGAAIVVSARRAQTVSRLVEAAIAVFAERGVQGASVEEICERAGFTRGAFYSNFDSLDELCLEVVRRAGEQAVAAATTAVERAGESPADMVGGALQVFFAVQGADPITPLVATELRLHAARRPALRARYLALHRQTVGDVTQLIVAGLADLGLELSVEPAGAIEILAAVYEQTVLMDVVDGTADNSTPAALSLLLRAIVRPIEGFAPDQPASAHLSGDQRASGTSPASSSREYRPSEAASPT